MLIRVPDAIRAIGYADVDDADYEAALGRLRRDQATEAVQFVLPHASSGAWLDIGCGPGHLLVEAARAGFQVRGIEPNRKAAAIARARVGVGEVTQGVLRSRESQKVNIVSCMDVLEHVPAPQLSDFAANVKESLTAEGVWLIKVPAAEGLYFRIAHAFAMNRQIERLWQIGYISPHTVYFEQATLKRFLAANGFEVVAERYVPELPLRYALPRLTMVGTAPRWRAILALPAIAMINLVERLRRKSDSLMVIARST